MSGAKRKGEPQSKPAKAGWEIEGQQVCFPPAKAGGKRRPAEAGPEFARATAYGWRGRRLQTSYPGISMMLLESHKLACHGWEAKPAADRAVPDKQLIFMEARPSILALAPSRSGR